MRTPRHKLFNNNKLETMLLSAVKELMLKSPVKYNSCFRNFRCIALQNMPVSSRNADNLLKRGL